MTFVIFGIITLVVICTIIRFSFHKIDNTEYSIMLGSSVVALLICYLASTSGQTIDMQVLSGYVTAKEKVRVHCRHSYDCNCHNVCTGYGKDKSCHRKCDTCYDHSFDNDWNVRSTIGTTTINTIDRQGLKEPPRWTSVVLGEPYADTRIYTNYLKAVPDSLFNSVPETSYPSYPNKIYDYYKINRLVVDQVNVPKEDIDFYNMSISEGLKTLASAKQVNLVVVITNKEKIWTKTLQAGWLNGKKNDIVVVIGAKDYPKIDWVDNFGWYSNDIVSVKVRDALLEQGEVNRETINVILKNVDTYWNRKSMSEFEYLSNEIEPSNTAIIISCIILALIIGGTTYIFTKE